MLSQRALGRTFAAGHRALRSISSAFLIDYRGLKGFDLYGKTMGVVGGGRIGMNVVRIRPDGDRITGKIEYLFTFHNLSKQEGIPTFSAASASLVAPVTPASAAPDARNFARLFPRTSAFTP